MHSHPNPAAESLAGVVGAALDAAGISLRDAATQTGIPLTTLSRRVNGLSLFTVAELERIAVVLGTTPSALFALAEVAA